MGRSMQTRTLCRILPLAFAVAVTACDDSSTEESTGTEGATDASSSHQHFGQRVNVVVDDDDRLLFHHGHDRRANVDDERNHGGGDDGRGNHRTGCDGKHGRRRRCRGRGVGLATLRRLDDGQRYGRVVSYLPAGRPSVRVQPSTGV